ncbi:hypothetical protein A3K87_09875 [Variovorax paradoxus]|uniref:CRISPR-associated protein Cas2 n=1 Tax=Variovorax paradoxus TaxID=34073 RepID=A0AA91DRJ0_VARPD|nr:hypothetical protein [Variovorax paradoxus]OAK66064.1 hypothetical protein A3K87_09875 [Variovorax paradoxus]
MAMILVTYDLKQPGRNYDAVHAYLRTFTYCKGLESVWLLDTAVDAVTIRDHLLTLIDINDIVFVTPLAHGWASCAYPCADWLNQRTW